jgi:hypothetical protein
MAKLLEQWELNKTRKELTAIDRQTRGSVVLKFDEGNKEIDRLSFFQFLYNQLESALHSMTNVIQRMRSRRWPSELVELNSLNTMFNELKQQDNTLTMTEDKFLAFADTHALTYPVKDDCVKASNCPLKFVTFIPSREETDNYEEKVIHPLPSRHEGMLSNDWHVLKPKVNSFLYSPSKQLALEKYAENCIPSSATDVCSLCTIEETTRPIKNKCLTALAQNREPWEVCEYDKIRQPKDVVVRLGSGMWAYSDDTPGQLVEACGDNEKIHTLPPSGLITLKPQCQYKISNNPISNEELQADGILIQDISDYPSQNVTNGEESIITTHFKDNFSVYIYTLGGTVLFLIIGWMISCYYRTCNIRIRWPQSRRRTRRRRANDPISGIPLIAAITLPRTTNLPPSIL